MARRFASAGLRRVAWTRTKILWGRDGKISDAASGLDQDGGPGGSEELERIRVCGRRPCRLHRSGGFLLGVHWRNHLPWLKLVSVDRVRNRAGLGPNEVTGVAFAAITCAPTEQRVHRYRRVQRRPRRFHGGRRSALAGPAGEDRPEGSYLGPGAWIYWARDLRTEGVRELMPTRSTRKATARG